VTVSPPQLAAVPTLADIASDRTGLDMLPIPILIELMRQCRHLVADVEAAVAQAQAERPANAPARTEPARLLSPDEAAQRLGVTVAWLYRHAGQLPFTRRLSKKALRFEEAGLHRWQAARRP
jgi:predicted DNA-binding transcriptional regulator AlpA